MNFYRHHIGDYAKKTGHLSLLEHGAYLLMLHAYYGSEAPLPVGEALYRLARAHTKSERAAVDSVAAQFWKRTDRGLVNGRAFEELEIATHLIDTARSNGHRGGRPKKTQPVTESKPSGLQEENPVGLETETQRVKKKKAIQYPVSSIHTSEKRKPKISVPSEPHSDAEPSEAVRAVFEHWKSVWNHPRAALDPKRTAAIKRALKNYSAQDLRTAIEGYRHSPHHMGQNDRQTVYDDIGLLLRDAEHIDAGMRFAEHPPGLTSELANHNVAVLREWQPPEMRDGSLRHAEVSGDDGEFGGGVRKATLPGTR